MKTLFVALALSAFVPAGQVLETNYTEGLTYQVEIETHLTMETTASSAERDGEPLEMPTRGGKTEQTHKEGHIDQVLSVADGKPTKVKRQFVTVGGEATMPSRDGTREIEIESPFEGVTLELKAKGDEDVEVTVVDGTAPKGENALERHTLASFLDGLLTDGEVKVDQTWDLEKDAIARALRLDVRAALYPPPSRDDAEGGGGAGGRGGASTRGARDGFLAKAEWTGKAKVLALDKDVDGVACVHIELEIEAAGEMDVPQMGGRRGGMYEPFAALAQSSASYSVELKGSLYIALEPRLPLKLELEGTLSRKTDREMERDGSTLRMHSEESGKLEYQVTLERVTEKSAAK